MVKTGFYSINSLFHANSEGQAKNTLLPDWEQQVRAIVGFIPSVEQAHCRRSTAIRQKCCCGRSCIVIQVSEYFADHRSVFKDGDDSLTQITEYSLLAVSCYRH
jgi:hypothetical protein